MEKLSPLQEALPRHQLTRDYDKVFRYMTRGFEDYNRKSGIEAEILRIANSAQEYPPEITLLDVGCGNGGAIEEAARILPSLMAEEYYTRVRIKAIGIDLNPVPSLIPKGVFYMDPETGLKKKRRSLLVADIHADDALTLATIPSDSVDILISSNCLNYVGDPLKAIESGWRVLKPGGIMVWWANIPSLCEPPLAEILARTDAAHAVFHLAEASPTGDYEPDYNLIVGRKREGTIFTRFPFAWKESGQLITRDSPHYEFAKRGVYKYAKLKS